MAAYRILAYVYRNTMLTDVLHLLGILLEELHIIQYIPLGNDYLDYRR